MSTNKQARVSRPYRLRTDVQQKLEAAAQKDNRTENNMLETILLWALAKPDLLEQMKADLRRRPVTLGELMGAVQELGKEMRQKP